MLNEKHISEITTAVEWMKGDAADIEAALLSAGKGETEDYEHFFCTMALHHMTEAMSYLTRVVENHDSRMMNEDIDDEDIEIVGDTKIVNKEAAQYERMFALVNEVLSEYPDAKARIESGEPGILGHLTGQVIKRNPKLNSATVSEMIEFKMEGNAA